MSIPAILAVFSFLKYVAGGITALTIILSFFEKTRKWLIGCWHWLTDLFADKTALQVDLKIVPEHRRCQWQEGSGESGKEAMLIYCSLFLTNVAPALPFQILDAYIRRPFVRANTMQLQPPQVPGLMGARLACVFRARFTISPPVCKSKQVFKTDVVLVDQYGGKHKARDVKFEVMGGPAWEMMEKQRQHQKEIRESQEKAQKILDDLKKLGSPPDTKVS
jgi:hypothetical protein